MLKCIKGLETIYESFCRTFLYLKKLIEQILTVMITAGKIEEKPPCQKINPISINALASAIKGMYIFRGIDINQPY